MSGALIKRIRKSLEGELSRLYAGFTEDHSVEDVVDAVEALLRSTPDIMPDLRDVAYLVAQAEDHRRTSMPLPKASDMFTREWAEEAEIRLGEGHRVSYANATNRQLRRKQSEQIKGIKRDTEAAEIIAGLIDLMDDHPDARTLTEAMVSSGRWPGPRGEPPRPDLHPV